MRRIKKTFTYSLVKFTDTKTNVVVEEKREGKQDDGKLVIEYIKANGYNPNLKVEVSELTETYAISAEDFMKYGEKIEEEKEGK